MSHPFTVQPDRSPVRPKASMRGRAFVRLFIVLQSMQRARYGRTLRELADECGVTTRTIRRDLEVLQEAGIPLVDVPRADETRTPRFGVLGRTLGDLQVQR